MPTQNGQQVRELQEAFQAFNQLSSNLSSSYHALEQRTEQLTESLAASNGDRRRQRSEKERLADRLATLIDALPGGVVVLDGEEQISSYNPVAAELLGEPLLGINWQSVLKRNQQTGGDEHGELQLKGGRRIVVSMRQLESEPGTIILLQDVTQTHQLEQALNRQQRLTAMGEMSASMAHQVRTPLASALLYISHLKRPALKEIDRLQVAEKIHARLKHMEHMVNDMLLFARGESEVEAEVIDLSDLLDAIEQTLAPQLEACGAQLTIENGAGDRMLLGNRDALLGALLNLATNAIQARCAGLRLRLGITTQAESITLTLHDNGPGIPTALQGKIFDPFYTTRSDGTGLGLAVVRRIIDAHGGVVDVTSEEGRGASFAVTLPASARLQSVVPENTIQNSKVMHQEVKS